MSEKQRSGVRCGITRRQWTLSALGLAGAAVLPACGGGSGDDDDDLPRLRFVNGTLNYRAVNVYLGSTLVLSGLENGGRISQIRTLDQGRRTVRMVSTNAMGEVSATYDFEPGTWTTALAYGPSTAKMLFIEENSDEAPSGRSHLRVFHADSSLGAVDVYVTGSGVTDLRDEDPIVSGLGYDSDAAMDDPVVVNSGACRIQFTLADDKTVRYRSEPITLPSRSNVTLVIVPDNGDHTVVALPERHNGNRLTNEL